jgi:hypothetical protein
MSPFGPFYPPRLQASVNHAERLARVLLEEEARTVESRHVTAWLVGRADEVERFVEAVVQEWRAGERGPDAAAASLDGYLAALHEGLARRLGVTAPTCCGTDSVTTETPPRRGDPGKLMESIDRLLENLESPRAPTPPPRATR